MIGLASTNNLLNGCFFLSFKDSVGKEREKYHFILMHLLSLCSSSQSNSSSSLLCPSFLSSIRNCATLALIWKLPSPFLSHGGVNTKHIFVDEKLGGGKKGEKREEGEREKETKKCEEEEERKWEKAHLARKKAWLSSQNFSAFLFPRKTNFPWFQFIAFFFPQENKGNAKFCRLTT